MRIAAFTLALTFLSGCATSGKFEAKMNGFVGRPESAVVGTYGPPNSHYTLGDGSRVLQYTRGRNAVIPGASTVEPVVTNTSGNVSVNRGITPVAQGTYSQQSTTYITRQAAPTVIPMSCTVNFTIDKGGIVRSWNASGNHCVAQ